MTEAYELRNMIEAEQPEFAAMLRGLTPEQWEVAVAVRRLVGPRRRDAHRVAHPHTDVGTHRATAEARAISEARVLEAERRARPTDELIDWLGVAGDARRTVQHADPALRARSSTNRTCAARSGSAGTIPADRLRVVLDFALTRSAGERRPWRRRGNERRACGSSPPICRWSAGVGPEVRGPGEAILHGAQRPGRRGRSSSTGDGVPVLAGRIKT